MAANFNFTYIDDIDGNNTPGLNYEDSNGNIIELVRYGKLMEYVDSLTVFSLAPLYSDLLVYPANSLVSYNNDSNPLKLYYNPNAISVPESWNIEHWTETTLAEYIKLMTT